jgi:uncharacterized protein (TIGR02646 family)
MHKLNRGIAPACLEQYQHGRDNWGAVTSAEKVMIWAELEVMQAQRCGYCEADISNVPRHIEHFHQKGRYPTTTFLWSNLFGSCNRQDSCGKHKDHCDSYDPADLIKPDVDDPEYFFVFVSDGTIAVRQNLNAHDQQRARETLRVFNLDAEHGPLRRMRQQAAAGYIQTSEEFYRIALEYPEAEWRDLLDDELSAIANEPFFTAIKHVLIRQN